MNARADFKAYFLTAAHCLSSSSEAATVVVYWNFQSPSCGSLSGGSLSQNQSGASLRATYASPDFTLLELNALPIPVFGVYYAGWDSTGNGASAAVCIHHPDGAEKAITFENDALQSTDYNSTILNAGGNHWRVIDWDSGTTGAGSSGAGLWNASSHRLIGQLHGGAAACGNDSSDWFGKFSASWVGGGTASSRLISWLDPDNTGLTGMDGSNPQGFVPIENYICTTNDGVVTIIYYTGLGGALIIPSTLNGMPVTSIGGSAFSHNTALTSITFSSSITNIGTNAFASCNNLFEVLFQGNAPSAGTNVFLNANNVTAYYLPGTFGWNATFGGRPARLKAGDFICSVDGGMVNIIDYTGSGGAVVIPSLLNNSPVSIGNSAFYSKTNLASVIISSGVTSIGQLSFSACTRLASIAIPNTVTNIGARAFESCSKLTDVAIPLSVSRIEERTFYACSSLIRITLPASVTNIGDSAFLLCTSLSHIILPQSVTCIEDYAFQDCTSLTRVVIPNKTVRIGNYAFYSCISLNTATIGRCVSSIGVGAFQNCLNLASVNFIGNSPVVDSGWANFGTAYYLSGTIGWKPTLGNRPTALWNPPLIQAAIADFDRDGIADLGVFNLASGAWYIRNLLGQPLAWNVGWGWSTAKPVPGDYDGDGKYDMAVFDTAGGYWYVKSLSGNVIAWKSSWGWNTAKPVLGDYNGDYKFDFAVYDTVGGYWYIKSVSGDLITWKDQWGWDTAKPVPGDYDGDGKWDQAVFDTVGGYWYIKTVSGNIIAWKVQWGWSTARPVPGDYDGDGVYDLAVFDMVGGYWYIKSLNGTVLAWKNQWGWSTAKPIPGDYNGDGKFDLAVYDTATGYWYIKSLDGTVIAWAVQWGWPGASVPALGD
jgi:hypothetical protein